MKVYERIKKIRLEKGFSQEYMAERLGIRQNNYGKIERGITRLSVAKLENIAEIFEIDKAELVNDNPVESINLIDKLRDTEEKNKLLTEINQMQKAELFRLSEVISKLNDEIDYLKKMDPFARGIVDRDLFIHDLIAIKKKGGKSKYLYLLNNVSDLLLKKPYSYWNRDDLKCIDFEACDKAYNFWKFDTNKDDIMREIEYVKTKAEKDKWDELLLSNYKEWLNQK